MADPLMPWYRRPLFGVAVIVVCLAAAAGVLVSKNYGAWVSGNGLTQGDSADALGTGARRSQLEVMDEQFDLSGLTIDRGTILDGGPGLDVIPAVTTRAARSDPDPFADSVGLRGDRPPVFVPAKTARFLQDEDRVVGVTVNRVSRAYPIAVLNWHECVNDVVGGVPIAVIYCPLCDSVSVIDRRVGLGETAAVLEFGISGLLHNSNVLFYDRQERGLWSQVKLEAVSGPRAGSALIHLDGWAVTAFARWRKLNPDGVVMSFETGYTRKYDRDPYAGFGDHDRLLFPVAHKDGRLPLKRRVVGVLHAGEAVALVLDQGERTIAHTFTNGDRLVMIQDASGGVQVVDQPEGARLVHTYWYAWAAFHPGTAIVE